MTDYYIKAGFEEEPVLDQLPQTPPPPESKEVKELQKLTGSTEQAPFAVGDKVAPLWIPTDSEDQGVRKRQIKKKEILRVKNISRTKRGQFFLATFEELSGTYDASLFKKVS